MNRYITEGMVLDAAQGKNVIIVAKSLRWAENEMRLAIESSPGDWTRISRANGNNYATHKGGGTIRPIAATASLRGHQADSLLVLDLRDMTERQQAEVFEARKHMGEILLNT